MRCGMNDITKMTALELSAAIRQKKISVTEAVNAYLDNIEKLNPELNCYITVCRDEALSRAAEVQSGIDSGRICGRLAGVPIAIKDNICTKGIKTTCASKMLENFVAPYNATVIDRINAEGMIILGKLNMDEFAMGSTGETSYFGSVKNPVNPERSAGGSSSGAAAAVAAELAPIALGSDTGGSVRQPASYCGVTGLKPTYSAVSRYGLIAYASSLDQIGIIGKNSADCAALFDVISGADERDMTCSKEFAFDYNSVRAENLSGKRIGIANEFLNVGLSPAVKQNLLDSAKRFETLGASIDYFDLPELKYAVPAYYVIACAEASSNLARYDGVRFGHRSEAAKTLDEMFVFSRSEGLGDEVRRRIMLGSFVLSQGYYDAYYKKAVTAKQLITKAFEKAFERYDFILSPVTPDTAPVLGESLGNPLKMYLSDIYTVTANLAGIPAVSLPCGYDGNGMPVGIQLMAKRFGEAELLSAATAFGKEADL